MLLLALGVGETKVNEFDCVVLHRLLYLGCCHRLSPLDLSFNKLHLAIPVLRITSSSK
jgi:hypothetical protein